MVRSNNRGQVGFLSDERRINVAITRARRHLAIVCDTRTCKSNEFLKSFLVYCETFGDVRSGFDYVNDEQTNDEFDLDDVKFRKLKICEEKPRKSEKPAKKEAKNVKEKGPVKIESDEDKAFEASVLKVIEQLRADAAKDRVHIFPTELDGRQRRIVHELAEKHNLHHLSAGGEESRRIMLSLSPIKQPEPAEPEVKKIGPEQVEVETVIETQEEICVTNKPNRFEELSQSESKSSKEKKAKKPKEKKPEKKKESENLLGEIDESQEPDLKYRADCRPCTHCGKYILSTNYLMHELHCSKLYTKAQASIKTPPPNTTPSQKPKSNDKIKQNPIINAKTDDFDELLEMFQKSNDVCNFKGCKALTKTLGQNCAFCNNRFCLGHSLAEVLFFHRFRMKTIFNLSLYEGAWLWR